MKKLLMLSVLTGLLTIVPAATAGSAKLSVSPANLAVGGTITFSGCTAIPNAYLILQVSQDTLPATPSIDFQDLPLTDSAGCFTSAPYTIPLSTATHDYSGKWTATVWYGNNHKIAALNFIVSP